MRHTRFAAVSVLSLVLMLAAASPAFAGISNFAIDSPASLAASDVQVTVTGNVSCPVGENVNIFVTVSQIVHGQVLALAFGGTGPIACAGAAVLNWTATAATVIPMHDGPAHVVANAFAFPPFEFAITTAEVHLKG